MEDKKLSEGLTSLWTFFNIRNYNKSFFWKYNFFRNPKIFRPSLVKLPKQGFTLIELLVVMAMIGVMFSFLLILINPFKQIQKARDSQRIQDVKQINSAMDAYYNDNNCYPQSVPFGSRWENNSMVYMQKVPQDPDCAYGGPCYTYVADNTTCPQWFTIFAKIYNPNSTSISCPLEKLSSCTPSNYSTSGYNFCGISGTVNCAYMQTVSLPPNSGSQGIPTPTVTPGPTQTPTPTVTPTPTPSCSKDYSCTGSPLRCNIISPLGSGQYCNSTPKCSGNCP